MKAPSNIVLMLALWTMASSQLALLGGGSPLGIRVRLCLAVFSGGFGQEGG